MQSLATCVNIIIFMLIISTPCQGIELNQLNILKKAYPDFIKDINSTSLIWTDNTRMSINNMPPHSSNESPSLFAQLNQPTYPSNKMIVCKTYIPKNDPGRIRNESFFAKMYGQNEDAVKSTLRTVYWMPVYFGHQYPLLITQVNGVNVKLKKISDQLELLVKKHPEFLKYLDKPSGTFYWRHIKNNTQRSLHSFGIAIDINANYANYWIWDAGGEANKINQSDHFPYKNYVPCEIVSIFEDNGFIWGGKWMHYDTMHFEYRPELLMR